MRLGRRGDLPGWVVAGGFLLVLAVAGGTTAVDAAPIGEAPVATGCSAGAGVPVAGFGAVELDNAATIVAVGQEMGVPERGLVIALATAMQEARLRNLNYGDRDSLGLFQQRPSQGWGTPAQVTDPRYAASRFYEGLLAVDGWQGMPLTVAAQAVQRSGFPRAYAKWEGPAGEVLAATTCTRQEGT